LNGSASFVDSISIPPSPSPEDIKAQHNVDLLFDRAIEKSVWEPPSSPEALGELLDSRHMLPLFLPSDPRFLGAVPVKQSSLEGKQAGTTPGSHRRSASRVRAAMSWNLPGKKLREVEIRTLQWIDGAPSAARWYKSMEVEDEDEDKPPPYSPVGSDTELGELRLPTQFTPLTRSRSTARSKGRASTAGSPLVEISHFRIPS
jgi:hypothetical protein